jgi:hypothetical protein
MVPKASFGTVFDPQTYDLSFNFGPNDFTSVQVALEGLCTYTPLTEVSGAPEPSTWAMLRVRCDGVCGLSTSSRASA